MFLSGFLVGLLAYLVMALTYGLWKVGGGEQWVPQYG